MIRHAKASSAIAVICGIVLALGAAQALAAKSVVKSLGSTATGTTGGLFSTPRGVAVNQEGSTANLDGKGGVAAGTFYVVDSANNRIQQFNPAGEFLRTWGSGVSNGEAKFQICETASSCQAGIAGAGAGQLDAPQGIAVDQATGNLFVSDQNNRRIDVFGPNGNFQGAFGFGAKTGANAFEFCTTGCAAPNTTAGAQGGRFGGGAINAIGGVAVDSSGNLYVASKSNKRIDVFKPILSGVTVTNAEFLRAFGWDVETGGVTTFEVCTVAANCKVGSGGANPGQFALAAGSSPADVGLDSQGNVYAVDAGANKRIQKFSSTPTLITEKFGGTALSEAFGTGEVLNVAVDPSSAPNRVLVSGRRSAKENKVAVLELDANGNKLHLHGEELTPSGLTTASTGLAVAKATLGGNLYLATATTSTLQGVYALNEGPTIEAATGISTGEATLNGTLVSNDAKVSYRFEYMPVGGSWTKLPATDADAGTSSASAVIASTGPSTGTLTVKARGGASTLSFNAETTAPLAHDASAAAVQAALEALPSIGAGNVAVSGGPGSPDGSTPYAISFQGALAGTEVTQITSFAANLLAPTIAVSKVATGLKDGTKYLARLITTRPAGGFALTTATTEFTTLSLPPAAPTVSAATATAITDTTAKLEGKVNPDDQATSYQFEYLTQSAYEANGNKFSGSEPISKAPASPANIGGGSIDIPVAEQIDDLEPNTTYRFRLSATNETGTTNGAAGTFTTHSQQSSFDPCANDEFRVGPSASLPDCRAYEQASPVDKNGGSIQGKAEAARTAEDGSTISFESTTGVPGGAGSQDFPTYMAKRGADSWSTTGLLPDPSSGQRAEVKGWTPDFATVFSQAERLGQGKSLLGRSTGDGTQVEIAPYTLPQPAYGYIGASTDGNRVLFEAIPQSANTLQLTPDAAPGKPNVYAWERSTGELVLAGVLPDGTTPLEGSRAGRGLNAKDYNQDTNLVGTDGSVFFNDRKSGQLYLRLNPAAEETAAKDLGGNCIPDPVLACTVHISASQKKNGKGPGKTDAVGPKPASFKAASPDGSTVTFTSSEKLTDDANTGIEPSAPAIARAKASDGGEKALEFIPAFAKEIAIDEAEGYVYWSDPENGRIGRSKLDGTDFDDDYITGLGEPLGIAVINEAAAKYIFWTERGELNEKGEPQALGTIGRADLDGTDVEPDCYEELTNPRSIAVDPNFIYWTMPEFSSSTGKGDVGRASLACEEASKNPEFIKDHPQVSGDIAVDASHIYTSSFRSNAKQSIVSRFTLAGTQDGFGIVTVSGTNTAIGLALSGTHLYWTDPDHNKVGRSDLNGDNEEPSFIVEAGRAEDPAIGGEHLFWSANQEVVPNPGVDLYQLDRESGVLTDLAPDSTSTNGTEVLGVLGTSEDGSYVYFAANGVPDGVGNSPNEEGESAEPGNCKGDGENATGTCNLYVAHGGNVDFIARLTAKQPSQEKDSGDAVNWIAGHSDVSKGESGKTARVSADGRVLVFRSSRKLTSYDNQGPRCIEGIAAGSRVPGPCLEFYRFGYEQMSLACLSCDPSGATPEGPARLASVRSPFISAADTAATLARNLSLDGNRFLFESQDALVAQDTNGEDGCPEWGGSFQRGSSRACQDVYEWEAPGTGSCTEDSPAYSPLNEGCIYLLSTGKSKEATFFADADLDGSNVFIYTYEQLVPQDTDALFDAYDVRVGGGLVAQHAVEPSVCAGEACRTEPIAPPPTQAPGSTGFSGPADPQPKRGARKARKKQRKQKRQRRKAKKQAKQRAAKQSGRAGR